MEHSLLGALKLTSTCLSKGHLGPAWRNASAPSPLPSPPPHSSTSVSASLALSATSRGRMQGFTCRSKRARLRALFSRIFRPSQLIVPDTARFSSNATSAGAGFFSKACNVVVNNSTFTSVQGDRDMVTVAIKALSKRVIDGAEYDSSARDPPPRCHPGTRVELNGRITTWFYDKRRQKALLWLNGPAGVGKSAVVQTFAESLAASNCLGATLFFSRPNNRKDPQRVFITIAFQLATKIPAYRAYVTEQLALDPRLLKKKMKEQFRVFIVEPFGNKRLGEGEGPWGVLLDGLDECEGVNEQCEIVQLISEFVLNFPSAPLVWAIASRPEPRLVATFTGEAVSPSHWSEHIPINSTEACRDVERYLNASFKVIRKRFSHVPSKWPSETQSLKLSNGALGLFVFATTAVRFMEDSDHADPVSRLDLLLSVIDHLDVPMTDDHPFALLDALYAQILMSIPPTSWRTTKRILGFALCTRSGSIRDGFSYSLDSRSLMGASIILGIEQSVAYGSLYKLHSVLEIPRPDRAHKSGVSFLHASFADYLKDSTRSKDFSVDRAESVDDIAHSLYNLCLDKPWDTKWARYTSQLSRFLGSSFYQHLKRDALASLYYVVTGDLRSKRGRGPFNSQQDRLECLDALSRINTADVHWGDTRGGDFTRWLFRLWDSFPEELENRGLFKEALLRDLKLDHLDCGRNKPVCIFENGPGPAIERSSPGSSRTLRQFTAELQSLQLGHPEERVIICGNTPEQRNAFISCRPIEVGNGNGYRHYCIPYPY